MQSTLSFLVSISRAQHPSCSMENLSEGGRPLLGERSLGRMQAVWPRLRAALLDSPERNALTMLTYWLEHVRTGLAEIAAECLEGQKEDKDGTTEKRPDIVVSEAGTDIVNGEYALTCRGANYCLYHHLRDSAPFIRCTYGRWYMRSRFYGSFYKASGHHTSFPTSWKATGRGMKPVPKVEAVINRETKLACKLHAHRAWLLRNLPPEELTVELAEALLCSFVFLTSRHAWNEDTKGLPEPELFAVIFAKRLELIGWLEQAPRADVGRVLNTVLRTATGVEEAPAAWAVWPEKANRGRYVSLPTALPSVDGRLPVHGSFRDTVPGIEVNLQALAFRMEGNQMQAMDEEAAQDEDVLHILGTGAKTMVCKDRKVVGTDYVISLCGPDRSHSSLWLATPRCSFPRHHGPTQ